LKDFIQPDEEKKILANIEKIKTADSTSKRIDLLSEINLLIMEVSLRRREDRRKKIEEVVKKNK
jgi:hypothetical protein